MASNRKPLILGLIVLFNDTRLLAQEPLDLLEKQGLAKSSGFFVVKSEDPVLQKFFNLRPVMGQMEGKFNEWTGMLQNEYEHQQLGEYIIQLRAQLNDLDGQIRNMQERNALQRQEKAGVVQYRNLVDQEMRGAITQRAIRENRLAGPRVKAKAEADFNDRRRKFVEAKAEIWPMVEQTLKEYDEIKQNESVLNALKAFNQSTKAHFKLGPSDKLKKAAQQVIAYERSYSPETATKPKKMPKRKGLAMQKKRR